MFARRELVRAGDAGLVLALLRVLFAVLILCRRGHTSVCRRGRAEPSRQTARPRSPARPRLRLPNLHLGGDAERLVMHVRGIRFRDANHARVVRELRLAADEIGTYRRIHAIGKAGIERQHVVLDRLHQKPRLQILKLLGVLLRQVLRLAEILGDVVELPREVVGVGHHWPLQGKDLGWWGTSQQPRCPRVQ